MILKTELDEIKKSFKKLNQLRELLYISNFDTKNLDLYEVYDSFTQIKEIIGNFNNDISFISCLMAKKFLRRQFFIKNFDVSEKKQSAPGLDIEVYTNDLKKIIAEIKTTKPYKENDFGANQIESLRNDFKKLHNSVADYKFLFVTEKKAFEVLERKYSKEYEGIKLVLLEKEEINNELLISQFTNLKQKAALMNSNNIVEILTYAFRKAYVKSFGNANNFKIVIKRIKDKSDYILKFYEIKEVVTDVYVEKSEIELNDAKKINIFAKLGDLIYVPFDKSLFTKDAIKQIQNTIEECLKLQAESDLNESMFEENSKREIYSNPGTFTDVLEPYNFDRPKTPTEEEVDRQISGLSDSYLDPFPFRGGSEDDYGDDSWA